MDEIDLKDILRIVLRKWWLIIVLALLFGCVAYLRNEYLLVSVYEANTTLYVGKNIEKTGLVADDLQLGTFLIADYNEIVKSRLVVSKVIEDLNLKGFSVSSLAKRISVSQRNNTRIIQISVSDSNPQQAMDIANKVAEVFQQKVIEIIQVEIVQVIDKAELPKNPVSPNKPVNIMLGILVGVALSVGLVSLLDYLDVTVKTPSDIEKFIGLPVIGTIPVIQGLEKRSQI